MRWKGIGAWNSDNRKHDEPQIKFTQSRNDYIDPESQGSRRYGAFDRAIIRGIDAKVLIHLAGSARLIDASISCHG